MASMRVSAASWSRLVISVIGGTPVGVPTATIPAVASADLSIRTVSGQRAAAVADQLRRWVADTVREPFEYRLTISEEIVLCLWSSIWLSRRGLSVGWR